MTVVGAHGAPLRGIEDCRIVIDGTVTEPRLDHPECVVVGPDGALWCGGERGQIYRIERDGSAMAEVATTGGFCLGMAFGPDGMLYVCDLAHAAVMRVDTATGTVETFTTGTPERRIRIPNYPVFDAQGRLYVSDSHAPDEPGPGIYRFGLDGEGELWFSEPLTFANGMALAPGGDALYVAETFAKRVSRIPIDAHGRPGPRDTVAVVDALPDGLALDADGRIYVACYEPSEILRIDPGGAVRLLVVDPTAHTLCHPTNVALADGTLYAANLGRWHITALDLTNQEGDPVV
ncbi:Virginiamycin B lyase [Baekduia alba]|uniref:SMP-30/gluconolactonase/LRE family protein n=1 Tax=Baekduia alba TaxID=2997333 RepID=UPI0023417A7A|nr:SMP-30/gluconolactonase/LRE family protein [Baekduia alba]WCB94858.1 Virginiamycin B lyase [Baekduia alba]